MGEMPAKDPVVGIQLKCFVVHNTCNKIGKALQEHGNVMNLRD